MQCEASCKSRCTSDGHHSIAEFAVRITYLCVIFRHETYQHQYRAMFVTNCSVRMDEVLRYNTSDAQKKTKSKRARRRQGRGQGNAEPDCSQTAEADESDNVYHPVVCSVCNSEVGVYDSDEVYHFFNVLASYA